MANKDRDVPSLMNLDPVCMELTVHCMHTHTHYS